jgi:multidrug efflux pump subunit AcrA (membrane-fusion protein)
MSFHLPPPARKPNSGRRGKSLRRYAWLALAVLAVGGLVGGLFAWNGMLFGSKLRYRGLVGEARMELFKLTIEAEGALEAAKNNDIHCEVKSNKKGGATIKIEKVLVADGQYVKGPIFDKKGIAPLALNAALEIHGFGALFDAKESMILKEGDVLLVLDKSSLETELKDQKIIMDKAEGEKLKAEAEKQIVISQNETDIEIAEVALQLADIEMEKYMGGDYHIAKSDIEKKLKDAESDWKQWVERAAWSKLMYVTGNLSKAEMESDAAKLDSTFRTWKNAKKELDVLQVFTLKKMDTELKGKVKEKTAGLKLAQAQAKTKKVQAESDLQIKTDIYEQEKDKWHDIKKEIDKCVIKAPADGLCIFYLPPKSKYSFSSSSSLVAQGEAVDYNQKLMQIPDLSRLIVKARVPQAWYKYLRSEHPDYPEKSQKAFIKVDGYGDQILPGHVKTVANTSSMMDWMSSDVKVYETEIVIDQPVKDIKPGMSARVTIIAHESSQPTLTIPIQAVVGSISMGKDRKVFVVNESGYAELRDIKIGMTNEQVVEVLSGLREGEKVALDPASLLSDDSELRPAKTSSEKSANKTQGGYDGGAPQGGFEGGPDGQKGDGSKGGDPSKAGKGPKGDKSGKPPADKTKVFKGAGPGGPKAPEPQSLLNSPKPGLSLPAPVAQAVVSPAVAPAAFDETRSLAVPCPQNTV